METSRIVVMPHPQLLEALFAFRPKISGIFQEVLGIHEINHLAITQINQKNQILTFSSTPALEYNLFAGNLWRFDNTYHPSWYQQCSQKSWQALYHPERYDELYFLKQIKHHYPIGYSLAAKFEDNFYIYSLASYSSYALMNEFFANQMDDFYKIGQYCSNLLAPLFSYYTVRNYQTMGKI